MSIEFHCGTCDQQFKVPDHFAGKQAKCKTCGQIVEVPYPAAVRSQPELPPLGGPFDLDMGSLQCAVDAEEESTVLVGPALTSRSSSGSPVFWIAVGGGVATLFVLAMVLVMTLLSVVRKESSSSSDVTEEAVAVSAETDNGPSIGASSPASSDASSRDTDSGDTPSPFDPPSSTDTESPFDTPSASDPPAAPESSATYATWGSTEPDFKVTIPDPGFFGTYAFSPPPQPYLAAGANVFDLETGEKVGSIRENLEGVERCGLSPNGKVFAKTDKRLGGKVDLVLCETGKLSRELIIPSFAGKSDFEEVMDSLPPELREQVKNTPGNPFEEGTEDPSSGPVANKDIRVDWLEFLDDNTLLSIVSSHFKGAAFVWDVTTGELKSAFPMEAANGERCALSRDRKYLASSQGPTLVVRELPGAKIVATMQTPPKVAEASFSLHGCRGLAFSADGTELAAYLRRDNMVRIVCWNAQAKIIFDQPRLRLAQTGGVGVGALQWVPDGSGWLLDGRYLLDRQSKRLVWQLEQMYDRLGCRFRTKESLLVNRSGNGNLDLVRMEFPWTEIRDALARIDSDEGVLLRPGGAATLKVQLGTLRYSNPQQTTQELTKVLTERLAIDDVGVAPDRPMQLVAFYTEKAGETLKVVERGMFAFDVRDTGKTVEETKGRLELKWVDQAGKVVWEREITRATARHGDLERSPARTSARACSRTCWGSCPA